MKGKSRLWKINHFEMEGPGPEEDAVFLRAEKLQDGTTDSRFLDDQHVQSWVLSVDGGGWTAEQNWGFEEINGARYYTRRVVVRKQDEVQRVRLVYDYIGPAEDKSEDEDLAYGEEA